MISEAILVLDDSIVAIRAPVGLGRAFAPPALTEAPQSARRQTRDWDLSHGISDALFAHEVQR